MWLLCGDKHPLDHTHAVVGMHAAGSSSIGTGGYGFMAGQQRNRTTYVTRLISRADGPPLRSHLQRAPLIKSRFAEAANRKLCMCWQMKLQCKLQITHLWARYLTAGMTSACAAIHCVWTRRSCRYEYTSSQGQTAQTYKPPQTHVQVRV